MEVRDDESWCEAKIGKSKLRKHVLFIRNYWSLILSRTKNNQNVNEQSKRVGYNCGNGQTTRRPMRREPDVRNETNPCADVDICHELSPDDNNTVSSDIYNLSPEVFDFRRRYSSNFLFAHVNINSFRHKYPYIHDMLIKQSVDLLAIS